MTEYNEILKAMEQLPDMSETDIVNAERMALNPAAHWDEVDENAHLVICISVHREVREMILDLSWQISCISIIMIQRFLSRY